MPFAPDSGLVFKEHVVSLDEDDDDRDVDEFRRRRLWPQDTIPVSPHGAHALADMAMNCVLRNRHSLNAELLKTIPKPVLESVWKALCRSGKDNLTLWKLFAPTGCLGLFSMRRQSIGMNGAYSMPTIIKQAKSANFAWLVNLALDNIKLEANDLVSIATFDNLRTVCFHASPGYDTGFSDRVLNSWAFTASAGGGLQKLEAIYVDGHKSITEWALQFLKHFPALELLCVHECSIWSATKEIAEQMGWPDRRDGAFMQFADKELKRDDRPWYTRYNFGPLVQKYNAHRRRSKQEVPLLEIDLGHTKQPSGSLNVGRLYCFERDWNFEKGPPKGQREQVPAPPKKAKLRQQYKKMDDFFDMLPG